MRHPTTKHWVFPDREGNTNLRELAARPGRFEHHLVVVARAGGAQLELATASEPLYFAHHNISDEWAVVLPSGDPRLDAMPLRTFVLDDELREVGRYSHRVLDLVMHPADRLHWPGMLKDPFGLPPMPDRRCVLSLVFCASSPSPSIASPRITAGRESDVRGYAPSLIDLSRDDLGEVARVARARLRLSDTLDLPHGGYAVVLSGTGRYFPCDLLFVAPGTEPDSTGIERVLLFEGDDLEPPPPSWSSVPTSPIALALEPGEVTLGPLRFTPEDTIVQIAGENGLARIPRYWLARTLLRIALHVPLGYVETYGGFYFDDRNGIRLGARGAGEAKLERHELLPAIELLHRRLAPVNFEIDPR
jgi:hypothetical protein